MLRDTVSMRAPWVICASMLAFAATVVLLPGCGGYQTLLMPTRLRLSPGVTTAAPGEIIHYELKGFSLVGIEVPLPEQSVDWELEAAPLPDDVRPPTGVRDDEPPGFVDFSGRFEASPIVQPGHYRSGLITATGWGEYGELKASVYVVVDGDIDPDAPRVEVWPQNLRVPLGSRLPLVTLSIDPRSRRVATTGAQTWSVLSGPGTITAAGGLYQAPAALSAKDPEEVELLAVTDDGRRASTYLTLDPEPAKTMKELRLAPEGTLKVSLGRVQEFVLYAVDRDERYIPVTGAEWLVEEGIGQVTERPDGVVEFLAQTPGRGALVAARSDQLLRREIISVIPGA